MIWNRRKDSPENFVNFHHNETRLAALEAAQRKVNEELLAYIRADMDVPWMPQAIKLCAALEEALKPRD
jgi:hypothetical protein